MKSVCLKVTVLFILSTIEGCGERRDLRSTAAAKDELVLKLIDATSRNDLDEMNRLIRDGADVNGADVNGRPVIFFALDFVKPYRTTTGLELLLENGADINARQDHRTLITEAIEHSEVETIKFLLDRGANIETVEGGLPLLCFVSSNGTTWLKHKHPEVGRLLLQHGCDPNEATATGLTPLHCAVLAYDADMVEFLLDNGANPNAEHTDEGVSMTPFHYARMKSFENCRKREKVGDLYLPGDGDRILKSLELHGAISSNPKHQ